MSARRTKATAEAPEPTSTLAGFFPAERKRYQDRTTAAVRELAHELAVDIQEAMIRAQLADRRGEERALVQARDTYVHALQCLSELLPRVLANYIVSSLEVIASIARDSTTSAHDRQLHRDLAERLAAKLKTPRSFVAEVWAEHGKPFVRSEP